MIEDSKRACLKRSFGSPLTPAEQALLDRFLDTEEGRRYLEESDTMTRMLGEVADVRVHEPVDSAAMVRNLEAQARQEIETERRRTPLALSLTTGIWLITGGLCLYSGKEDLRFFAWTMLIGAGLFAVLFFALWRKHGSMLEADDFLRRLEEERDYSSSPRVIAISLAVAAVFLSVLFYGIAKGTGAVGLTVAILTTALAVAIAAVHQQQQKHEHRELWDWWDGRGS